MSTIDPNPWTKETYEFCPSCDNQLVGRIVGARVVHKLRCDNCGWTGNTEELRAIRKRQCGAILAQAEVRKALAELPPTRFVGHDTLECDANIIGLIGPQRPSPNEKPENEKP